MHKIVSYARKHTLLWNKSGVVGKGINLLVCNVPSSPPEVLPLKICFLTYLQEKSTKRLFFTFFLLNFETKL